MSNSNHSNRGFLPLGVSRKRDPGSGTGYEGGFKRPPKRVPPSALNPNSSAAAKQLADLKRVSDNRVLAGYLANEFLTKGTVFGQKYDPARAEAVPVAGNNRGFKVPPEKKVAAAAVAGKLKKKNQNYAEVANLLKSDGTHIPGIVNPTQLAQWLQM